MTEPWTMDDPLGSENPSQRRIELIGRRETDLERWADPTNLEAAWEPRSRFTASIIPRRSKVLDLGCGKMFIEKYLHPSCTYIPADLVKRDERTIYCDLNKSVIPEEISGVDVILLLGVVEYIFDVPAAIKELSGYGKRIVLSYCDTDSGKFKEARERAELGWVNSYSKAELRSVFDDAQLKVLFDERFDDLQSIYTLVPRSSELPVKRVAVLSYSNVGNFGDRLGMHALAAVMPSSAMIDRIYFEPWLQPKQPYDLVVLGIGNSIFAPLLNDSVLSFVRSAGASVGIFGTQYRKGFSPERMKELVRSLDFWFARSLDDLDRYSVSGTECTHLGDWLIGQFMMARPTENERLLKVGQEIWKELPLDRVISKIQSYRRVFSLSTRVFPIDACFPRAYTRCSAR